MIKKILKNIKISAEELLKAIDKWVELDEPKTQSPRTIYDTI